MDDIALRTYVVATKPPPVAGREADVKRWVVLAPDGETACDIVQERVAPKSTVVTTDESPSDEEVATFGLKPEQAVVL